jgi:preprotein translocase subunit SecE
MPSLTVFDWDVYNWVRLYNFYRAVVLWTYPIHLPSRKTVRVTVVSVIMFVNFDVRMFTLLDNILVDQ